MNRGSAFGGLVVCCGLFLIGCSGASQNVAAAGTPDFKSAAEEAVDCVDGMILTDHMQAQIFKPQSLRCRALIRKLQRSASPGREATLAEIIHSFHAQADSCWLSPELSLPVEEMKKCWDKTETLRTQVITDGSLRVPAKPAY